MQKNYGTSPFFMGKSTTPMAIFNSYVSFTRGQAVMIGISGGNGKSSTGDREKPTYRWIGT